LTLTYVKQWNVGLATVAIDGITVDPLDTSDPTRLLQPQNTYATTSGVHTVTITVSDAKNAASPDPYIVFDNFIVATSAPPTVTVTGLSPTSGPAAGGTVVTITGTGFDTSGATSVRFGASAATAVGCASAT